MALRATVLACLLSIGCDGGAGSLTTADDYQHATVAVACQYYARCGLFSRSQEQACESLFMQSQTSSNQAYSPTAAIAAGRLGYDSGAAQSCLAALRAATCDLSSLLAATMASCKSVLLPKVAAGGACKAINECIDGYCDQGTNSRTGCSGVCKPYLATGSACSAGLSRCAPGSDYCDTTTKLCTAAGTEGAACDSFGKPCLQGLSCRATTAGGATTCQSPAGENQPCSNSLAASACTEGLYCSMSVCKRRQPQGMSCTDSAGCNDGLACVIVDSTATEGTCQPRLDLGQACTGTTRSACASDAACDGTCKLKGQVGDDCSGSSCNLQLYCNAATKKCASKIPYGQSCATTNGAEQCLTGSCDSLSSTCTLVCS